MHQRYRPSETHALLAISLEIITLYKFVEHHSNFVFGYHSYGIDVIQLYYVVATRMATIETNQGV